MTNPTTNYGWVMPTSASLVTNLPADFNTFGQAVDTSMAELKGGTTGQVLSKTSATDMDFTWVTTDDANAIQNAIVDAKGDLIAASANDVPARLAVGANGETLVADSAAATGLKWGGGWTTWTPTYQNFTLGNGTVTARYQQIGKTVNFYVKVLFGSTTSITGAVGVSLPANNKINDVYINGVLADSGTANFAGLGILFDNFLYIRLQPSNGTYLSIDAISATTPMVWTTNDFFLINGTYEVA